MQADDNCCTPKLFATVLLLGDLQVGKTSMLTILAGHKKVNKLTYTHCPLTLTTNVYREDGTLQMKVRDTGGESIDTIQIFTCL